MLCITSNEMKTKALIIKKQYTNEYDQLVTCYTQEFGKLTAIAKSVLKNNSIQAMHLDVLNLVDFELVTGRGVPIITGAQMDNSFFNIKSSLASLAVSHFFTEVIDKMVFDNQKDDVLWGFLVGLLEDLNSRGQIDKEYLGEFFRKNQLELLNVMGYAPNLEECSRCQSRLGSSYKAYSPEFQGVICSNCFLAGCRGVLMKDSDISMAGVIFQATIGIKFS